VTSSSFPSRAALELRGALVLDQLQPQLAAALAASGEGFFPLPGECAFWAEIEPGIAAERLLDTALKQGDVRPGALVTERRYGTFEVHGPDQGQVREAGRRALAGSGLELLPDDPGRADRPSGLGGLPPEVLFAEVLRQIDAHHAAMVNRSRAGSLLLAGDTLFTLEVAPAVWVLLAANAAEKAAPIRLIDLENHGAVGRLRLGGSDAAIEAAVRAVEGAMDCVKRAL
jgi:hypothetical protein